MFAELQNKYGDSGLQIIGISLDEDGWKAVRPVIESDKINYRVALATDTWKAFGGDKLPESFLLGKNGLIRSRFTGIASKAEYERAIVKALGKSRPDGDRLHSDRTE